MLGKNHLIFNAALAIVTENLFHLAGPVLSWSDLTKGFSHPSGDLEIWITKGIYYGCTLLVARLPDSDLHVPLLGQHRGLTHSLVGGLLFALISLAIGLLAFWFLQQGPFPISQEHLVLVLLAILSLTLGCFYHMLADSLTVSGILFFWPARTRFRLLPQALSLRTGRSAEHVTIGLMILVMSGLVWTNILGL